jgi:hypothetical protein
MSNRHIPRLARGLPRGEKACRAGLSNSKRRHPLKAGVNRQVPPVMGILAAAGVLLLANAVTPQSFLLSRQFNKPGYILMADQLNRP